ncbi:MAG: ABC transporter substrate-binding protein [Bacteroidetes bacterium]|nr:ABC transporter substrate-binding protein [Bacteroidota bacterium]
MAHEQDAEEALGKRMSRRRLIQVLSWSAAGLALSTGAGCSTQPAAPAAPASPATTAPPAGVPTTSAQASVQPVRGGTLRLLQANDIVPKTAPFASNLYNYVLNGLFWDKLGVFRTDRFELEPWLAESLKFSSDYTSMTIKLHSGVKFHSGRPLTAQDVKWNVETLATPEAGSQMMNAAKWVQKIETPDDYTIILRFDKPRPQFIDIFDSLFIADRETLEAQKAGKTIVGTGPFMFKEWVPGDHLTAVRNPDYWQKGLPYLDEVTMQIVPDTQTQLLRLQTGAADFAPTLEARDAFQLQKDSKYTAWLTTVHGDVPSLLVDVAVKPFDNKLARQALSYLIDRKRVVDSQLFFGEPIALPWDKTSPAYTPDLNTRYPYDPAKAKDLLAQAGVGSGVTGTLYSSVAYPGLLAFGEMYQAELAKLGWNIQVVKRDAADFAASIRAAKVGGLWPQLVSWMGYSPVNLFNFAYPYRLPSSTNFETPAYRKLIEDMNAATDPEVLKKLYRQMNEMLLDECHAISIASSKTPVVTTAKVHGFAYDRVASYYFVNVWMEK